MTQKRSLRRPAGRLLAARLLTLGMIGLTLTGCGSWFGEEDDPRLPGERISVLRMERRVEADPRLAETAVNLPAAVTNEFWPQAGGYPDHAMGHLALGSQLREVWRADIGSGSSRDERLLAHPIVAEGRIYTLDTDLRVSALDAGTGRSLWRTDVSAENEEGGALGGGVAFGEGRLLVTTGFGELLSLDPATGDIRWRVRTPGPVRAAPTVIGGRAFVVTVDNQTVAYSATDGATLWTHTGILETAGLLGASSPAADGNIVAVPYSSGELFALRVENGRVAWSDSLAASRRAGALANLADIRGMPVIDRGLVIAVSHSGRMAAIDERSGGRAWDQEIGGVNMPWPAGDFVFVLSNDNEVVALTRQGGRVRWVTSLPRYSDPEDRSGAIIWSGPVLAGERLWLVSTSAELIAISPANGEILQRFPLPDAAYLAPVVAEGTLYVLTDGGELVAFR
jgi:outer membrane protein assembly factor BamB